MTKKVVVLSERAPKESLVGDVCAVVANVACLDGTRLLAETLGLVVMDANDVVSFRRKYVRPPAQQHAVHFAEQVVYNPIALGRVDSPCAQGTSPALFTAYVLARVHGAGFIEWVTGEESPPQMSPSFEEACARQSIEVIVR